MQRDGGSYASMDHADAILASLRPHRIRNTCRGRSYSFAVTDRERDTEPFLLNFIVVVVSAVVFGRAPGFFTVAATSIASLLYFEPTYSFRVTQAVHLLAIEAYAVIAAASVEAFCRLVDSALVEKSE